MGTGNSLSLLQGSPFACQNQISFIRLIVNNIFGPQTSLKHILSRKYTFLTLKPFEELFSLSRTFFDPLEISSELCLVTSIYLKFKSQLNQITNDQTLYVVPYNDYYCETRTLRNDKIPLDYKKLTKSCYFCSMYTLSIHNHQRTKMIGLPEDLNFNILDK